MTLTRRGFTASAIALASSLAIGRSVQAQGTQTLRLSTPASDTDQRFVSLAEVFGPAVAGFATYQPHYNASLIAQGAELESVATGDLEMAVTSAQEIATFLPDFAIFSAGYVHQSAEHQLAVFNDEVMDPFKQQIEDELGVKLLSVMYLGQRHVNLRMPRSERDVKTPADLAGVNLRMPNSDAWQFLGRALGANPTPMAFTEVYTALQTGSVDGQDNPLPTVYEAKFYEVTKQIVLTRHLVDLNYIAINLAIWEGLSEEQQQVVQKAADDAAANAREAQLKKEADLVAFMEEQGLELYEPDLDAFRSVVQDAYLNSDLAQNWPAGALERINALAV